MSLKHNPPISLDDCSSAELHIHVLGCYPKGESILIVLWNKSDRVILKSVLIDCYERNSLNKFENLFKQYSLEQNKFDYIIWTHPDVDHSTGISHILDRYSSKITKILVPEGLGWSVFASGNGILWKSWLAIKKKSFMDKKSVRYVSADYDSLNLRVFGDTYEDGFGRRFKFHIEILSPISHQSFRLSQILKKLPKNNISVAVNIQFGDNKFFFGGDIVNEAIGEIQKECFYKTIFVKIPHHSSSTSDDLPSIYNDICYTDGESKLIHSVSTMFEQKNTQLPDANVLNKYANFSKYIFLTDAAPHNSKYGIWSFRYKYTGRLPIGYNKEGDAILYTNLIGNGLKFAPIP